VTSDPVTSFREEITAVDLELLDAFNRRLEVVRQLHDHKAAEGLPLRDPDREASLVRELREHNPGPLSDRGVDALFQFVLDLTRRELHGA
jgi:chorismate mutase/prephenate dehydratase